MSDRIPIRRSRVHLALTILTTICVGLFLRSALSPFPKSFNKYAGDALWAAVVYFGIVFLLPRWRVSRAALLALIFAWSVEYSQLYHAPWLDSVRETIPGRLILGSVFNYPDLFAYAVGIVFGMLVDSCFTPRTALPRLPKPEADPHPSLDH